MRRCYRAGDREVSALLSRAIDAIHEAVDHAIDAGMTAAQFKKYAAESWDELLKDRAKLAVHELLDKR
jgi:hypothetical protein